MSSWERLTGDSREVCDLALRQALSLGYNYIHPEHVLLALLAKDNVTVRALAELGVEPKAMRKSVLKVLQDDLRQEREA